MWLSRVFRKYDSVEPPRQEASDNSLAMRPEVELMLKQTLDKAKRYGGDPFVEYRTQKRLPERFEYGMNCLLDRICEMDGDKVTQRTYEAIRNDPKAYRINVVPSGYDHPGIPVLFGVTFEGIVNANEAVIARAKQEFMPNFFMKLNTLIDIINKEKKWVVTKISLEQLERYSQRLLNRMIFCKTKDTDYYDFLMLQALRNGYVYGTSDRHYKLSELLPEIIVMIYRSEKEIFFLQERELSSEEGQSMNVVYEYHEGKPAYSEGDYLAILENGKDIRITKDGKDIQVI